MTEDRKGASQGDMFDPDYSEKVELDAMLVIEPTRPHANPGKNLREETERWLRENPAIWDLYVKFALQMGRTGRKFGVKLLTERIRWECAVEYDTEYKICNDYTAYVARKLVEEYPHLGPLMRFRETKW